MRPVYKAYPDNIELTALNAEALMCISPRGHWNLNTGKPSGNYTVEAREVIETALQSSEGFRQPAHCHLCIHLVEMSRIPT